ncbi:MAG TPA: DUF5661 family protein [Candidatus Nanoarchaeia archaeon]|nr:DUF5661 family protein [Candidatus Nanoarchaeia archaeon]
MSEMNFYRKDYSKYGFTLKEAKAIGDKIGVNWDEFDLGQLAQGIKEELEHGDAMGFGDATNVTKDDLVITARIALAHLYELPDYYFRLEEMEDEGEKFFEENDRKQWLANQREMNKDVLEKLEA